MEADISSQAVGLASSADFSLMNLFIRADIIVKSVIIILIACSVYSWAVIIEKFKLFKKINQSSEEFETKFWNSKSAESFYNNLPGNINDPMALIFKDAMQNLLKRRSKTDLNARMTSMLETGLEKSLDVDLKKNDKSIQLTVDKDIQFLIREELMRFNKIFKTKGSASILMDIDNGEILSIISLPDFDPNQRQNITDVNYINRATKGVYELGSVFKTFTLAAALNEKIIETNTKFKNLEKSITCGKNKISEYDKKIPSNLTAEEILIRSGNIGSVRIGQAIGIEKYKKFLNDLDLINSIKFDIEEMGEPIPFNWGKCKLATTSYGHGITTTILQLTSAYSTIANGGFRINPTLIKKEKYVKGERILEDNVSSNLVSILRKIVTTKEGTATLANVEGYEVAGKTGTAEKILEGGYSRKKINTFASVFPASNPKYSLVVMLDEPKTNSEYVYNYRDGSGIKYKGTPFNTAGWTSVEVVGQIIEKIGPILATKYTEVN